MTQSIKIDITGLHQSIVQIHSTMPAFFPASIPSPSQFKMPGTVNSCLGINHSFFQSGISHSDFIGRARRILAVNGSVLQGVHFVINQLSPASRSYSLRKLIRVKSRFARYSQNFSRLDFYHDSRSVYDLFRSAGHRFFQFCLHFHIQSKNQIISTFRRKPAYSFKLSPRNIYLNFFMSFFTSQGGLKNIFQTIFSDKITLAIK